MDELHDDFFEPDEPVEEIRAAFERGEKFVTTPPLGASISVTANSTNDGVSIGWGTWQTVRATAAGGSVFVNKQLVVLGGLGSEWADFESKERVDPLG